MEAIVSREKDIQAEFSALAEMGNKHESYLNKVFKRKVKRSKVRVTFPLNKEKSENRRSS